MSIGQRKFTLEDQCKTLITVYPLYMCSFSKGPLSLDVRHACGIAAFENADVPPRNLEVPQANLEVPQANLEVPQASATFFKKFKNNASGKMPQQCRNSAATVPQRCRNSAATMPQTVSRIYFAYFTPRIKSKHPFITEKLF